MSRNQLDRRLEDLDKAMKQLRSTMRGLQIRTAGFKKDHDRLARSAGTLNTVLTDAKPLVEAKKKTTPAKPR